MANATTSGGLIRKFARRFGWILASKFLLPESTAAQTRSFSTMDSSISSSRGPELPMQVVQPYAATEKPSSSREESRPAFWRYSVTTREPGAREVFILLFTRRPLSTAFFARRPAARSTAGFEVFVQEV